MKLLVTGGSSDIGRAILKHRADLGDNCFYTASSEESLDKNKAFFTENNIDATGLLYNFSKNKIADKEFDYLVLNAAAKMPRNKVLTELSQEEIEKYITDEILGNVFLLRELLPYMQNKKFGRIVFISSLSTVVALSKYSSYIMVKSALEGLIKNVSVDYAKYNVLANSLRLGLFKTSRLKMLWKREQYQEMVKGAVMQGRMGEPTDILKSIDLLLDKDLYMAGSSIDLAGGMPIPNSGKDI